MQSQYQLHIQLPSPHHGNNYMHHQMDRSLYACMPGTPDAVDSGMSGDESPSESRKNREMAPFLRNLRNMLERENPEVLRWSKDGTAFEIHDMEEMMNTVLPKYFKHKKYTSFQRQLNYFNFKKWTKSRANVCTFSNEYFTRHEPYRSTFITRKKSISSQKEAMTPSDDQNDEPNEEKCLSRKNSMNKVKRDYGSPMYSCDSPVPIKKDHMIITNGSLDTSFGSMSLHKKNMQHVKGMECFASPYENKHLTRVMGKRPQRMEDLSAMHDDFEWIADSDLENIRDSVSSFASTQGGEWDDNDMNWVDFLPYNDAASFEPSNENNYMRHQYAPVNNNMTYYAASI
ncbi:HSF-type DNA-binding protein [Thraustotheca clavata]|uniref:HSF-type DNA-binding protein n=1 Tax=Thraustotheca clavata TaxID=74557 RepID=A0A1W0A902_9STRA|nr:HSF-type DNA-binding protein [Thraustotheca clavata]